MMPLKTTSEALSLGRGRLSGANEQFISPDSDARSLLTFVTGRSSAELLTHPETLVSESEFGRYQNHLEEYACGRPLQYITGECEFMSLMFSVDENVLIPRPETELLVEKAISLIAEKPAKVLEIGCGSGCIAVSVAKYCVNVEVTAVDISRRALELAGRNAASNGVMIKFLESDLFGALSGETFDMIISNPPYIKTHDIAGLDKNVREYEPFTALDGGEDGLCFYRQITEGVKSFLKTGGYLLFEIGHNQGEDVINIMKNAKFEEISLMHDYAGFGRIVFGIKEN